jgi:hypothetical protein
MHPASPRLAAAAMDESKPKKTVLVWQPPAAATQLGLGDAGPPLPPAAPPAPAPAPATEAAPASGEPAHVSSPAALGATLQAPVAPAAEPALVGARSGVQPRRDAPPPTEPGALPPGAVIGGRYVVKALAGMGGFAAVYRAADDQIPNHEVAVKLLNAPAPSPQARAAALRELTLIASVSHPSVVQFKDYGWHEDRLFFAMPWYRGKTLASAAPLSRADARRVFERSAYGLQAMHDAGISHYDIKPENIFLADIEGFEAGFPVLLDLGIAAKRGEKPTALTPDYAAPETALSIMDGGATPVGTAADVFALALSLRNVLEPETAPEVTESLPAFLLKRSTEPLSGPTRKEFRYLKPLFARWLSLDPAERPSAAEFAQQLAALTAPEELRAARKHLLLRVVPIVVVLGLVATVLALQLQTTTKELVGTRQQGEKQIQAANQRFAQLRADSADELDEKLQLARDFQTQRDQLRVERDQARTKVNATAAERDRARTELRARTRERDQTRDELATQTAALQQASSALDQKSQEAAARTRELGAARAELSARTQELERRTAERDRTQTELAARSRTVQEQEKALAASKAALTAQGAKLAANDAQLKKLRADLDREQEALDDAKKQRDKARDDLERRTKQRDAALDQVKALTAELERTQKTLEKTRRAAARAGALKPAATAPSP